MKLLQPWLFLFPFLWSACAPVETPVTEEETVQDEATGTVQAVPQVEEVTVDNLESYTFADCTVEADASGNPDNWPDQLSDTGCFEDLAAYQFIDGVLEYKVVFPFWSDSALKRRAMVLPAGSTLAYQSEGAWDVPNGSFFFKTFFRFGVAFETRIIKKVAGDWAAATYQWNSAGDDASYLSTSVTAEVDGLTWTYPSPDNCTACHDNPTGYPLSLNTFGMNTEFDLAGIGQAFGQIEALAAMGVLTDVPTEIVATISPDDKTASLNERARSYLHMNCAFCHQDGGEAGNDTYFGKDVNWDDAGVCNHVPDDFQGDTTNRVLVPGNADKSLIFLRLKATGGDRMPPIGSDIVDARAIRLLRDWINAGATCDDFD